MHTLKKEQEEKKMEIKKINKIISLHELIQHSQSREKNR